MAVKYLQMSDVRYFSVEKRRSVELNESRTRYAMASEKIKVFLSHKHDEDPDVIENVKALFLSVGSSLYIDWQDQSMPEITSVETAENLKNAIRGTRKFVVLATPLSIKSIWIPWEIGLADQMKGLPNMAMLPILDPGETWEKREYCRLYDRIVEVDGVWSVMGPSNSYSVKTSLYNWLRS